MIDDGWERVKEILHRAMQLSEDERCRFLDEACAADRPLRLEIESLLAADAAAPRDFLRERAGGHELEAEAAFPGGLDAGDLFEQRFRLIRKLGEGGMGQVWLADQIEPVRRLVALKLIRAGMYDQTVLLRFHAERQSLAVMDHPCIAKVFDAGATAQGQPYFVMEYVPGPPIVEYCDQRKLPIAARLELFIRACEGVQHAHQKAVIHRDLKPANILVVEVDGAPMPRIIDFGLARQATRLEGQAVHTQFGQFIGTPGYMSPEQVDLTNQDIDTRTDVYSLGVLLCVLLTGLQPFETDRRDRPPLYELLRKLREEDPPSLAAKLGGNRESVAAAALERSTEPKQLLRQLHGDLNWIAMKALERERERRYRTPSELADDLRRNLKNEPVTARPANAAYQLRKFIRRHRIAAAVALVIGALAIVASVAGLVAVRKQREAEIQRSEAQYQTSEALKSQARLLTEVAAQRLKNSDLAAAQGIILEVLTDPKFPRAPSADAVGVFQDVRASDRAIAVLSGHGQRVFSAVYSPDGSRILTSSADATARVWDAGTGAQLAVLSGHGDRVFDAAYSSDGTRIVTASRDKTARVWDAGTGSPLLVLRGHADRVACAAFSPDGTRIVTASWDKLARIWDARTGSLLVTLAGHSDVLYTAAFSPDGSRIVTASQDKTARIWNSKTGAQIAVLAGHGDYVASAAYSPDGSRIVTASADTTARIWDAHSAAPLAVLLGHGDVVYSAAFSPDGKRVVTGSWDKTARIWDARTGAQLAILSGHTATIASAAYSPDGGRIVTASQDATGRIWESRVGSQAAILAHADVVYGAAYSPDGTRIVTASEDKLARIFDSSTGMQLGALKGHDGAIASAAYSRDGSTILTASQDKTARTWDARTQMPLTVFSGHADRVYSALYSPDGLRVITASRDKTARLWDAHTGSTLAVLSGHLDRVYFADFSPDGTRAVTASRDGTARIWDAGSGTQISVLSGHADEVLTAVYSPDGTRIVTASADHTARIWDVRKPGSLPMLLRHGARVLCAAYSPDGKRIVTTAEDKTVRIWDSVSGVQLAALLGHGDAVYSAAYSPDGTRIITSSVDKTVRIWDARVPADIHAQIQWYAAAQADPLPALERARFGLSPPSAIGGAESDGLTALGSAAEREELDALAKTDARARNAGFLAALADYARAAELARLRRLPDNASGHWRRRRASLARTLALEGLMPEAANTYETAVVRAATATSTIVHTR